MSNNFNIDQEIKGAETLPSTFYRSQEVFDLIRERIFLRSWHWMGAERDLLPMNGSAYPVTVHENYLDEPVVLVKDKEGVVRTLSNVCTHRANLVVQNPGKQSRLSCMYHGRQFELDGSFKSMPEFSEAENFPRPCDNLHTFSTANFKGYLFSNMDPAFSFESIDATLMERVGFLPLEEFKLDASLSKDYLINCHWALYCDNYLEGFHIPFVHPELNKVLDYNQYRSETYELCNLQIGYSSGGEETFDLPEGHPDFGKEVAAYYYWIFPNMMLNFYPWGLSVNIVKPMTINRTKVSFITYIYDEMKFENGAGALLDKVEREDEFVVESVHKGLKSRFYKSGRFSPTKESGVHQFHTLLAKFLDNE
jgi:choline monooxygenase